MIKGSASPLNIAVIFSSFLVMLFSFFHVEYGVPLRLLISTVISIIYTLAFVWIMASVKNGNMREYGNKIAFIHTPLYMTALNLFNISFAGRQLNNFINLIIVIIILVFIAVQFRLFETKKIILSLKGKTAETIKDWKKRIIFLALFLLIEFFFLNLFLSFRNSSFSGDELPGKTGRIIEKGRTAASGRDARGFILYGPYLSVNYGVYNIVLNYDSTEKCNWDITYDQGNQALKRGVINPGTNNILNISFRNWRKINDLEFRLYYDGNGDITVHEVAFKKALLINNIPSYLILFLILPLIYSILLYLAGIHIIPGIVRSVKNDLSASTHDKPSYYAGLISVFISILLFIIIIFIYRDFGISLDEYGQNANGTYYIRFFLSLFKNTGVFEYNDSFYYGDWYEAPAVLFTNIFPFLGIYEARHLFNALTGLVGILYAFKIARLIQGNFGGLIVLLLLSTYPSYFGHMFMNPVDIPFAAGFIASIYYMLVNFNNYPDIKRYNIFKLGLCIGITSGIRSGGLVLFIIFAFSLILQAIISFVNDKSTGKKYLNESLAFEAAYFFSVFFTGYLVMLLFWPFGAINPLQRPFVSLAKFSNFTGQNKYILDYLATYLLYKLPDLTIILSGIGLVLGSVLIFIKKTFTGKSFWSILILIFSLLFPLLYIIVQKSSLYDEIRHIMFLQCLIITLSGLVLSWIVKKLIYNRKVTLVVVSLIFCTFIFSQVINMVKLHPYEYINYNYFSGGLKGAAEKRLQLEYWYTGYKEMGENLIKYLKKKEGEGYIKNIYNLYFWGDPEPVAYYVKPNIHVFHVTNNNEDFFLDFPYGSNIIYQSFKEGIVLHTLYQK